MVDPTTPKLAEKSKWMPALQAVKDGGSPPAIIKECGLVDNADRRILRSKDNVRGWCIDNAPSLDMDAVLKDLGDADEIVIPFKLSDSSVDRQNDTLAVDGWELENFEKNPVIPWGHNYGDLPVGRSIATWRDADALRGLARFASKELSDFGHMVGRFFEERFLNAVSVGFNPFEWKEADREGGGWFPPFDFIRQELLEYSAVVVPAHAGALVEARGMGIDVSPYVEWCERILDGEGCLILPKQQAEMLRAAAKGGAPLSILFVGNDSGTGQPTITGNGMTADEVPPDDTKQVKPATGNDEGDKMATKDIHQHLPALKQMQTLLDNVIQSVEAEGSDHEDDDDDKRGLTFDDGTPLDSKSIANMVAAEWRNTNTPENDLTARLTGRLPD